MLAATGPNTRRTTFAAVREINYYALREQARNAQAEQLKRLILACIAPHSSIKRVANWLLQHLRQEWPSMEHRPSRP